MCLTCFGCWLVSFRSNVPYCRFPEGSRGPCSAGGLLGARLLKGWVPTLTYAWSFDLSSGFSDSHLGRGTPTRCLQTGPSEELTPRGLVLLLCPAASVSG